MQHKLTRRQAKKWIYRLLAIAARQLQVPGDLEKSLEFDRRDSPILLQACQQIEKMLDRKVGAEWPPLTQRVVHQLERIAKDVK